MLSLTFPLVEVIVLAVAGLITPAPLLVDSQGNAFGSANGQASH